MLVMKSLKTLILVVFVCIINISCIDKVPPPPPPVGTDENGRTTEILKSPISTDYTLKSNVIYILDKQVFVENNATLRIEPGTIIKCGENSTTKTRGALIIKPGSRIIAEGTIDKPIVFTSNKSKGKRSKGDWAGIIIMGNAPVNLSTNQYLTPASLSFGGTNPNDNSGILKYVRIEFAGGNAGESGINTTKWSALTFAGVGASTQVSYVQVTDCDDDAFEFIGGNVNCKYLYSLRNKLIDFKTSFGYTGTVQFAYSHKDNSTTTASANCLYSENDYIGSSNTPITAPTFVNCTFVGYNTNVNLSYAVHLKNNTRLALLNSVVIGHNHSLFIDGPETATNASQDILEVKGCVISNWKKDSLITNASFDIASWYKKTEYENEASYYLSNLKLDSIYSKPPQNTISDLSPLISGASNQSLRYNIPFIEQVPYRGAFNSYNWLQGWSSYQPNELDY